MNKEKPLRSWQWKFNDGSDPCTYYCDVYRTEIDWYGESHHPLWKGPFDIGRQSYEEYLSKGPMPAAMGISKALQKEIREFVTTSKHKP
jgi:hypothetical protein